ncbi:MAG: sigma 54-interacting transcriptional regulator [Deltaproteobacteria bacterium]|nr:sigma 54-interacting transcriptional regulator [Deltaproteobacteria bacterium]MBW2677715.1 sigma 54-interacting transcriptional regulator [Deltaproteobacteria bacterium]
MFDHELDTYWKTVVNTIRDGIMIVNTEGAIVSINRAFEVITGYDREELIGRPCTVLDCNICKNALLDDGRHWCTLFEKGTINKRKCIITTKDGTPIHALKNASILKDNDGNIIGAVETVTDITEIMEKESQLEEFRREMRSKDGFHGLIGNSPAMRQVYDLIENAAGSDAPVIIHGESGTGKELVSKAIHEIGLRRKKPFVKVNCASLTESLLESELFGHVKGAYTGAYKDRAGRFEKAHQGDIFLDEIGDMPLSTQVKLLRVLEEKTVERVGDSTPIPVDVRIISATNRDLVQLVDQGIFRKDFYFRINVIPIHLPLLSQRVEDIPLLAEVFFRKMRLKSGKSIEGISREAMDALMGYAWPGNVRELRSAFEYAFVTCQDSMIQPFHFPADIFQPRKQPKATVRRASYRMNEIEKRELIDALERASGNKSKAAEFLGVSRVTVWNRMKRFGIDTPRQVKLMSE